MVLIVPFAHAGHLVIDLPVFLGPVLLIALWLLVMVRRGRRSTDRDRE